MKEPCVVAVLGYGCHLTPEMARYLDKVVLFIQRNPVYMIIVSGGFTNPKTAPGVSEAGMLARELRIRLQARKTEYTMIIKDEKPIDTKGNLRGIKQICEECRIKDVPLVIFCDSGHAPKVRLFSLFLHRSWPTIKTHSLTNGMLAKAKHIFIVTPLEMGALIIPYMERRRVKRREEIVANS